VLSLPKYLAFLPVALQLRKVNAKHLHLTTYLLVQASRISTPSIFGLLVMTAFISNSHSDAIAVDTYHAILAPDRFDASSHDFSSRFGHHPVG
jgi:hypothetical protein